MLDSDNIFFPTGTYLFSCDFESLYTNIVINNLLNDLTSFMSNHLFYEHISVKGFHEILRLILLNNVLSFKGRYFIQTKGIAMGTICGPTLANLFLSIKEELWSSMQRPIFYKRFIDDLFIADSKEVDISFIESFFDGLKLNASHGNTVNFLDLYITFDSLTNSLKFSLYIKKTNTFSYLIYSSNHPNLMKKNIPKSLFIRLRRICSSYSDYLHFSFLLIKQLLTRGYNYNYLVKLCHIIGNIDRFSLLPYKDKHNITKFSNHFILPLKYEDSIKNLHNIYISSYYFSTIKLPYFYDLKPLKVVNSIHLNFKKLFSF